MEPVPSPTSLPPEPTPTSTTEPLIADIVEPVISVAEQSHPDKTVQVPELRTQTAVEDEAAQLLLGLVGGPVAIARESDASMDIDRVTGQSASSLGAQKLELASMDEVSTETGNGSADAAPVSGGEQPVVEESVIEETAIKMPADPDTAVSESVAKPSAPVSIAGDEPATDGPTSAVPAAMESLPLDEGSPAAVPMDVEAQSATQEVVASALVSMAGAAAISEPVRESSPVQSLPQPQGHQHLSPLPSHAVPFNSISPNSLAHLLHPQSTPVGVPAPQPSSEVPRQADIAPLQIHMIPAKPISPPVDPPQSSVSFALPADQPQPVASTSYIPPASGQNEPPNVPRPVKKRKRAQPQNPRRTSGSKTATVEPPVEDGVIRCVCMFPHDDGFTIQCDHCQTWQHAVCMGIAQDDVPEIYRCDRCSDRKVDQKRAMTIQMEWIENEKRRRDAEGSQPVRGGKTATRGRVSKGDREGSRGRVGSMALDDVDMGDGSGRERASPAASASSAMPPPVTTTKGKRRGAQPKPRAKPGKEHPTSIENFPSPFATSSSASSAAFKEPSTPASVQAQIQALSAGEDDTSWKAEAWRLEYTDVKTNVIRGRGVHQAIRSFLDEWLLPNSPEVDQKKRRRPSGSLQDASDPASPAEPGQSSLPHSTDLPPPDLTTLGPPIPPAYLAGVSLTSIASATVVKAIQESSSFLPLGYTVNPSAPHSVTAPAYLSSAVFARPRTFGVFADQPVSAGAFIGEYKGEIMQAQAYRQDPINQYSGLGMPKPFVRALGPPVDLMIDARGYGGELRFIRSGCHPNVVIRPTLFRATSGIENSTTLAFGVFATRPLAKKEELVLGWEWDDQHVVHFLDVLTRCPRLENGRSHLPAIHPVKLQFILDKIETILTAILGTFTTCACTVPMNCAVAQMAHLVETGGSLEGLDALGKGGKPVDLGELVGATRGWRRLEEEIERMAREEMLLAQEFQRRETIRRREEQPSEDEEEDEDEDEEELPAVKADVPAPIEVDKDSPSSPVKVKVAVKDFARVPKSLIHPVSSPISSAGSTPKAVKTALNGVPGLISTAVEDGEDSGEASDTSTLTQPLSHRSFDSDEESDRDDSDALSEPPVPSSPAKRSPVRIVRNRIDSGEETEEDEAPLRRHGKIVAKAAAKALPPVKTPQGLKQSQSKLAGKTKVNGVKKVRRILSPTVPLSPQLPLAKPWDKSSVTKVGPKKSQLASVPAPRKPDAMDVDEPEVKAPVVEAKPPVTLAEGGRTPPGPIAPLPEMPLPDVPAQALNSIFDEPMPAQGDQQPLREPSREPEPEPVPEREPEPVPEPVKQPTPPPVRRLTLADYAARRKVAPTEGEMTKTEEPAPAVVTPAPAFHDTPSVETIAPAPSADFVSSSSSAAASPHIDIPSRVESSVKADPSPVVNPSLESVEEPKPVDSPLQLSPVRKLSESGAFDWSRHLPSSSTYAAHLPTETREVTESKPEAASWLRSPRYDGFRSLSSGSSSALVAEANSQPSAEPSWNPRPVWAQQEVKQASPPSRPPPLPQTPATAPVGLDLELERPPSPPSPPFMPRSRPPPPLMQRDLPPHQQPGGMPPRYPPTQESPVMQRTPLPPPGPRNSWPSSAPPKEPPRGPRGWHAGPPHSPSNGLGHLPHRAPTTPSPGYGQPLSGRGGYGPPRGPSSEYRGSRPWSRGRARGRWMA